MRAPDSPYMIKTLALVGIFLGELIGVGLEITLADKFRTENLREILRFLILISPLFIVCLLLLLLGYIYGFRSFQKIWIVTIVSWSSIILIEPIFNYFIFHELPSNKTWVAGVFALTAIVISII